MSRTLLKQSCGTSSSDFSKSSQNRDNENYASYLWHCSSRHCSHKTAWSTVCYFGQCRHFKLELKQVDLSHRTRTKLNFCYKRGHFSFFCLEPKKCGRQKKIQSSPAKKVAKKIVFNRLQRNVLFCCCFFSIMNHCHS